MTTIAYRRGMMAADTQHTFDDTKFYGVQKISAGENSLIGVAGASRFANCVFEWWKLVDALDGLSVHKWHEERQLIADDIVMLLAHRTQGLFRLDCTGRASKIHADHMALGTGAGIALGAMFCGGAAGDAIAAAIKYDLYTGGDVVTVEFNP